ncbi:LysR family transcriptional regulator [Pollutimonas sp. M17]|uniref:LysR family transcriptional regulator n=1 Tax=Pollutimonas sp. M17 TaxID=2962065 RepID=UPI0021F4A0AA|nr:LysR family transcriptional regulator [Pollutimonas sp. M17]UYO92843.1 LysR family transcriptional regulator [Pollutimonas sp. M17]
MRITLSQLEAFYWAAHLGSIHAAARHVHLSQPAVSARIRELENTLEAKLFERSRQRVTLTETGLAALRHAEQALHSSRQLEHFRKSRDLIGKLRLGADECSATVGLTAVITQFKEHFPSLELEITVDVGSVLNQKLNARELDMALLTNPSTGPEITDSFIGWMPFAWVAAPSLPIHADPFRPRDARGMNIATHSAPSTLHAVVESWLSTGGTEIQSLSTSNSLALIARLVAAGHAIAILPLPLLQEMLATGVVRTLPCDPPIAPARFYISYMTATQSSRIDSIVELARDTLLRLSFLTADR